MSAEHPLVPLLDAMQAAVNWLEANSIAAAIVGGVAASLHGRPRVTKDVDFVAIVDESCWASLVKTAPLPCDSPECGRVRGATAPWNSRVMHREMNSPGLKHAVNVA